MAALEHMTNDRLRAGLTEIDEHGWDSQAGHTLLTQVRVQLVRPIVARAGLFGKDAAQAEATGWAEAWECLASPYLRTTARPWNVLWTTVRRAVRSEVLATRLVTSDRRAWEMKADATRAPADASAWQEHRLQRPLSLDVVDEAGQAPAGTGRVGLPRRDPRRPRRRHGDRRLGTRSRLASRRRHRRERSPRRRGCARRRGMAADRPGSRPSAMADPPPHHARHGYTRLARRRGVRAPARRGCA